MIPVLYSATVWLEWQYDYSATVPSQFYGATVLRLQFYWPNVRVPDTTEPRTWLIRQSASLLPPFADVMSPSPFCEKTQSSPPSVPPHSDHPLWCHPPLLRLSSYLPLRSLISPSPTSGSSYFPLSNPAKTKWIEEDSKSVKQWHEETARPKPWVIHTILVTLSILSVFIKKWVNLIKIQV